MKKLLLLLPTLLTLTSCSEYFTSDDKLNNSFCKVQFLCYQGEPNWLGIIVLLVPGVILFLIISLILVLLPGAIKFSIEQKLLGRQEEKKRKQAELEKLDRKQKILRVISKSFRVTFNVLSILIALVVIGHITGILDQLL